MRADPLLVLGDSILLDVLSYLPLPSIISCALVSRSWHYFIESEHSTSIYRRLAWDVGVSPRHMTMLIQMEDRKSTWREEPEDPDLPDSIKKNPVDWKAAVKSECVVLQNWKKGRAQVRWMPLEGNEVWRIKVDRDQGVMYSSSRSDYGILASDSLTNEPLFEYVCPTAAYAHLEFARGHLIFNIGPSHDLEVHLTPPALRRLSPAQRSALRDPSQSLTYRSGRVWRGRAMSSQPAPRSEDIPPRGHLTYSKTISPPTDCMAFRARVDKEDQEGERAVLATAGVEAVYIWGLDDDECERYDIPSAERVQPMYIEFDDDYIFLCGEDQMHIISRLTKKRHLNFPATDFLSAFPEPGAIYHMTRSGVKENVSSKRFESTPVFQHVMLGQMMGDIQWAQTKMVVKTWGRGRGNMWSFSACHYTSNDLFCINRAGLVYVLRDYRKVLAIANKSMRDEATSSHLLVLCFNRPVMQLGTFRESVVFNTPSEVYLLHTSALPAAPFKDTRGELNPAIGILSLADVSVPGLMMSSCLQMDREKLYMVYSAHGDDEAGGTMDHRGFRHIPVPNALLDGDFGICVKSWDFDAIPAEEW